MDVLIGALVMLVGVFIGALLTVATHKTLANIDTNEKRPHVEMVETLQDSVGRGDMSVNQARSAYGYDKLPTEEDVREATKTYEELDLKTVELPTERKPEI